jgi:hypothetical protein
MKNVVLRSRCRHLIVLVFRWRCLQSDWYVEYFIARSDSYYIPHSDIQSALLPVGMHSCILGMAALGRTDPAHTSVDMQVGVDRQILGPDLKHRQYFSEAFGGEYRTRVRQGEARRR